MHASPVRLSQALFLALGTSMGGGILALPCNGEDDHVHLLLEYPTKVSFAKLVNSLKGVSSRIIRQAGHPSIRTKLWGGALWSSSYFAASCGGSPPAIIRQYIEEQRIPSAWRAYPPP